MHSYKLTIVTLTESFESIICIYIICIYKSKCLGTYTYQYNKWKITNFINYKKNACFENTSKLRSKKKKNNKRKSKRRMYFLRSRYNQSHFLFISAIHKNPITLQPFLSRVNSLSLEHVYCTRIVVLGFNKRKQISTQCYHVYSVEKVYTNFLYTFVLLKWFNALGKVPFCTVTLLRYTINVDNLLFNVVLKKKIEW